MEKKLLFLDFDGVLFDTLKEVYLVNRCLFSGVSLFDEVDEKNYQLYSKYKFLVYNIWMFYYYNPLFFGKEINEDSIIDDFMSALKDRDLAQETKFCEKFLQIRADLVRDNYEFWKNLETPYKFFFDIKKLYELKKPEIVIVSKKNKASILERFNSYEFNLDGSKVFAREILDKYSTKGEFMHEYMQKHGFESAIFVDDNNNNLKTCDKYENIIQILATWGNSQPFLKGYTQEEAILEIEKYFL